MSATHPRAPLKPPLIALAALALVAIGVRFSRPAPTNLGAALAETSAAISEVSRLAMPAVVSISTLKTEHEVPALWDFFGHPFDREDERPHARLPGERTTPTRGPKALTVGSGFIVDPRGLILTNNHVVADAERITVQFGDQEKFVARIVGTDPRTDLAVLRLEHPPAGLRTLPFADSDRVRVGDWAIAVGSPFGLRKTVTLGIVSAKGRSQMGVLDTEDFLQTDAAINPGSSGGPLLNLKGEVIGLNTAIFSQSGGFIGIGFAIPARTAREISTELIAHGRVRRSWLGLTAQDLDPRLARYFHVPTAEGALITQVTPGSPAEAAALAPGDVVARFDRERIHSSDQLKSLVAKAPSGQPRTLEFVRAGRTEHVLIQLRETAPPTINPNQLAGTLPSPATEPTFGATLRDLLPELAHFLKLPSTDGALVIDVRPGSRAADAGLLPGDVVLMTDRHPIRGARDLRDTMRALPPAQAAVLYVQRGPPGSGERLFLPLATEAAS